MPVLYIKAVLFDQSGILRDDSPVPGIIDFIKELKQRGLKTALCRASSDLPEKPRQADFTGLFDITTSDGQSKTERAATGNNGFTPSARDATLLFDRGSAALGVHPFQCAFFSGNEDKLQAALRSRMKAVGVGPAEELPSAPEIISGYTEIDIEAFLEYGCVRPRFATEAWSITESAPDLRNQGYWESVFALGNGYLGIRGTPEEYSLPGMRPGAYVNGVHERVARPYNNYDGMPDYDQVFVNHNDWRIVRLHVGDETFSLKTGQTLEYARRLDMKRGLLTGSIVWESPSGKRVRLETTRLASLARCHSAAILVKATPLNFDGRITLESIIEQNARLAGGGACLPQERGRVVDEVCRLFSYRAPNSGIETAMACAHRCDAPVPFSQHTAIDASKLVCCVEAHLQKNQTLTLAKHICLYTSLDNTPDIEEAALKAVRKDFGDGFEIMRTEQIEYWRRFWGIGDIEIDGNTADNQALRFSLFHLRQAHHHDNLRSISATGLTGENYNGCIFWDTDMFMLPLFAYTEPELAKRLSEYRRNAVEPARLNACKMGKRGIKFPWTTLDGRECSPSIVEGPAQYHINADVAYGMWRYYQATHDEEFLKETAAQVMFEVSRFFADLGGFIPQKDNRFCINFVSGPDEYNYCVNNNCYTNVMARFQIGWSLWIYERLRQREPAALKTIEERIGLTNTELDEWRRIVDRMFIPRNGALGIYEQDDTFLCRHPVDIEKFPHFYEFKQDMDVWELGRLQVIKQADVLLMMAMLPELFNDAEVKSNYDFYIQRTRHVSSLSPSIHSMVASRIGYRDEAYDLFRNSAYMDLFDYKRNTSEGIHFACCGGAWLATVNGFGGMRDTGDTLSFNPTLPAKWQACRFNIRRRGQVIRVEIRENRVTYSLIAGNGPISFESHGKAITLDAGNMNATTRLDIENNNPQF